ncbi:MAG: hypothetical protein HQL09_01780 [Nitrospirae bacterium]|nr:hypothetical protein [Nitrospirota bacterium]
MIKRRSVIYGTITVLLILTAMTLMSPTVAYCSAGTNWVLIARSAGNKDFYIDSTTLKYCLSKIKLQMKEEQIATAWFKIVTDKNRKGGKKTAGPAEKYINQQVSYAKALIQTDCYDSTLRVLVIYLFDKNDKMTYRIETLSSKFEEIPQGCVFEDIKDIICR